jgi:hypothetical protein
MHKRKNSIELVIGLPFGDEIKIIEIKNKN